MASTVSRYFSHLYCQQQKIHFLYTSNTKLGSLFKILKMLKMTVTTRFIKLSLFRTSFNSNQESFLSSQSNSVVPPPPFPPRRISRTTRFFKSILVSLEFGYGSKNFLFHKWKDHLKHTLRLSKHPTSFQARKVMTMKQKATTCIRTRRVSTVASGMTLRLSTVVHLTCCKMDRRTDLKYKTNRNKSIHSSYRPLQKRERTGKEYGCFPFV